MATVTYNGVDSAVGGNIFKGVNFWIARRIPFRDRVVGYVKDNGGNVVPLEKYADMLIADHARKDAPAGSYSFSFIEDSVKNGIIQLKDRYRIGRDPDLPRPVGAGGVTKSSRTPFTSAEDAALAKWVLSRPGNSTGNKIFQDYEQFNPRHTWQSWRNRWVKKLQLLPRTEIERMARTAPDIPDSSSAGNREPESHSAAGRNHRPAPAPAPASEAETRQRRRARTPVLESIEVAQVVVPHNEEVETQAEQESRPAEVAEDRMSHEDHHEPSPAQESEASHDSQEMRKEFYDDLREFSEANNVTIKLRHMIGDKQIGLWELAEAVNLQQLPLHDIDWIKVAVELGIQVQSSITIIELRDCYHENLAEFIEAMSSFEQEAEAEGEDVEDEEERLVSGEIAQGNEPPHLTDEEVSKSPPSYIPSSPPTRFAGTKRALAHHLSSSGLTSKRPRYSRNAEIPSTPDEKVGVVRQFPSQNISPSIRKILLRQEYVDESEASQHLPPLPAAAVEEEHVEEVIEVEDVDDEEEDEELEPEPEPEPQLESEVSLGLDATPSRRPRHGVIDHTPIPFNLQKTRHSANAGLPRRPLPSSQAQPPPSGRSHGGGSEAISVTTTTLTPPKPTPTKASRRSLPSSFKTSEKPPPKTDGRLPPSQSDPKQSNRRDIHRWVEHYESLGYSHNIVVEGLKRTTMTPGPLADLVMQQLKEGHGVPTHHEGIWTDRDDADLELALSTNIHETGSTAEHRQQSRRAKRAFDRLTNKHGAARMELRRAFQEAQTGRVGGQTGG